MSIRKLQSLAVAACLCAAPASWAALGSYSQDFEGLDAAAPDALGNDGWLIFGNVFDSGGGFLFGYGVDPAPNGGPGFSGIISGQGGAPQGNQQLSIYNDYNCCQPSNGHFNGTDLVESNVFQEQIIDGTSDAGTWTFSFDGKAGDLAGSTTATAFIKVLDPNAGFFLSRFETIDTTNLSDDWNTFMIPIDIDASLAGQILQFGFLSNASNFEMSQNIYDNVNFIPVPAAVWLFGSALGLLGFVRRRMS